MDTVTQITLGAAVGEAVLGKKIGNKAILWGGLAGLIPDLDVIPSNFMNDVNNVDFHRGVFHSIAFFLVFTPLLSLIAQKIHSQYQEIKAREWHVLFFLGLLTHALLDCFTTWGTQLFWPFEYRVAFQSIFVIDPLYTIPLLTGVIGALLTRKNLDKRRRFNRIGLIISSLYLLLTFINKQYVNSQFRESAKEQGITYVDLDSRPTPFNNLLWSANIETDSSFQIGYYSVLDTKWPITFQEFSKNKGLLSDSLRKQPLVKKLLRITTGDYVLEKAQNNTLILHDLRFGQLAGWLPRDKYPKANQFVFSYQLHPHEILYKNKPGIYRTGPSADISSEILNSFWERIKGK